jgi:16S rRNA (guanine966-N2)-methyltransferase
MRIVRGKFAGRNLTSPGDSRVRPTAEPVRDAVMKMLTADLERAKVLDLFAGTGAMGLEALSRGALYVDFVEMLPGSLHSLKANIAALRVREKTRIYKKDALPFVAALERTRYDIAFVDPPYESRMLDRVIDTWKAQRFARILVCEHAVTHQLPRPTEKKLFGDTAISIYRHNPAVVPPPAPEPETVAE